VQFRSSAAVVVGSKPADRVKTTSTLAICCTYVPSSLLPAPTASLFARPVSTCVAPTLPTSVVASMPSTVVGADTRPTYVSLGVPLTNAPPIVELVL